MILLTDIVTKRITFQILAADKTIYEQALGMEWSLPKETLLRKEDLPSYCSVICTIEEGNNYSLIDCKLNSRTYIFALSKKTGWLLKRN